MNKNVINIKKNILLTKGSMTPLGLELIGQVYLGLEDKVKDAVQLSVSNRIKLSMKMVLVGMKRKNSVFNSNVFDLS